MSRAVRTLAATIVVFAVSLGVSAAVAAPPRPGSSTAGCPAAVRCGLYRLGAERWATNGKGVATIRFRISTLQPWLVPQFATDAIEAATRTWEAANPRIDFVFEGVTYDIPQLGNNVNEIAWVPTLPPDVVAQTNHRAKGSRRLESDTLLNVAKPWGWNGCDGQIVSCSNPDGAGLRSFDLQALVTQQLGHWIGLQAVGDAAGRELTMYGVVAHGERHKSTLGLGDVLGARAAYPCRTCRTPRIFTP